MVPSDASETRSPLLPSSLYFIIVLLSGFSKLGIDSAFRHIQWGVEALIFKKLLKRSDVATCRPRRRAQLLLAAPAFPHRHRGSAALAPRRYLPVAELRPRSFADRFPNALRVLATSCLSNRLRPRSPAAGPAYSHSRAVPSWSVCLPAPGCRS